MVAARSRRAPLRVAGDAVTTLLDELRANAATLADFDHAVDYIDHHGVAALLTRAAKAIEDAEAAREVLRRERNAAMNERDEAAERANRLHSECVEYAGHVVNVERERDAAYEALRDYAPSCHQCGELGPSRVNRRAFGVPCVVDACDAHRGETYQEVKHAAALRAAAKAGE
jgi:hypothetical protein